MPYHSSQKDEEDARLVTGKFSILIHTVVLDTTFDNLLKTMTSDRIEPTGNQPAEVNPKVGLRMLTLYYLANLLNYMVAG